MACATGFTVITNSPIGPINLRQPTLQNSCFSSCTGSVPTWPSVTRRAEVRTLPFPVATEPPNPTPDKAVLSGGPTGEGRLHSHGELGERDGRGEWERKNRAGGTAWALRPGPLLRTPPELPCPNLTFIEKSIRPGGPFKPPRKHDGGGAAVAWAKIQRPQTLGDKLEFNRRKSSGPWCLLNSKANNRKAPVNQLA